MSLRDRLGKAGVSGQDKRQLMFERLGVTRNPYPPAGEPTGHPHMETPAEEPIVRAIESFERDRVSQVFLIEGTQGVGKSNLLNYFQGELQDLYKDSAGLRLQRWVAMAALARLQHADGRSDSTLLQGADRGRYLLR